MPILIREDGDTDFLRLCAALAASCGLHLALFMMPYLGTTIRQPHLGSLSTKNLARQPLQATLRVLDSARPAPTAIPPPVEIAPPALQIDQALTLQPVEPLQWAEQATMQTRSEGADLLPIPAPVYFPAEHLTKAPQPTVSANLDPDSLRPIVASGHIILKLWIDAQGIVTDVHVEQTDMPEAFSSQAIAAFHALRFIPGERNGQRVGSIIRIDIHYDDGRAASP